MRHPARQSGHATAPHEEAGFTVVEVLVVVGVLMLLSARALAAIQHVRETSRRMTCQTRMHELGIAVSNFEGIQQRLPSPLGAPVIRDGKPRYLSAYSAHHELLPYIEQQAVLQLPHTLLPGVEIESFQCPSDGVTPRGVNYRVCCGASLDLKDRVDNEAGAFSVVGGIPLRSVTDGLSHTIALSERYKSDANPLEFDDRDYWCTGAIAFRPVSSDQMLSLCTELSQLPAAYDPYCGWKWHHGDFANTLFNALRGPNPAAQDCTISDQIPKDGPGSSAGIHSARSYHPQGVNVAMLDGTVGFRSNVIDVFVWRQLSAAADGK
jgi:hypothetical protein